MGNWMRYFPLDSLCRLCRILADTQVLGVDVSGRGVFVMWGWYPTRAPVFVEKA